jgi:hypothetical protein
VRKTNKHPTTKISFKVSTTKMSQVENQNEEEHTYRLNFVFGQPTALFNNNEKESNEKVNDDYTHIKSHPNEKRLIFLM